MHYEDTAEFWNATAAWYRVLAANSGVDITNLVVLMVSTEDVLKDDLRARLEEHHVVATIQDDKDPPLTLVLIDKRLYTDDVLVKDAQVKWGHDLGMNVIDTQVPYFAFISILPQLKGIYLEDDAIAMPNICHRRAIVFIKGFLAGTGAMLGVTMQNREIEKRRRQEAIVANLLPEEIN